MFMQSYNSMMDGFARQFDAQVGKRLWKWNSQYFPGTTKRPRIVATPIKKSIGLADIAAVIGPLKNAMPLGEEDYKAIRRLTGFLPETLPDMTSEPEPPEDGTPPDESESPEDEMPEGNPEETVEDTEGDDSAPEMAQAARLAELTLALREATAEAAREREQKREPVELEDRPSFWQRMKEIFVKPEPVSLTIHNHPGEPPVVNVASPQIEMADGGEVVAAAVDRLASTVAAKDMSVTTTVLPAPVTITQTPAPVVNIENKVEVKKRRGKVKATKDAQGDWTMTDE